MQMQQAIEKKLGNAFQPAHLEVVNESYKHAVPPGSETHFKVVVVSDSFSGQNRVKRQQSVNSLLAQELASGVHALSMETHTPEEWDSKGRKPMATPDCLGGGKHDR